jgi:hypothetical protein
MTHHSHPNAVMSRRSPRHARSGVDLWKGDHAVTAVRMPAAPSAPSVEPAPGPVPRRLRTPRWLDLRLVLGVLLVLGSVLLGARVVGAADATVAVWAVASDLAAGSQLTPADLVTVDVRLDEAADAYVSTGTDPTGRTLGRAVRGGELLPRSALEEPGGLVHLALPVQSGFVPPDLQRGRLVDVYAMADPRAGAAAAGGGGVTLVVGQAPVQAVSGRSEGVLSAATSTVQVVVALAADDAPDVLAAVGGRPLVVVVHDSVDDGAAGSEGAAVPGRADSGDTPPPADPTD